jgi:hypothetical protein
MLPVGKAASLAPRFLLLPFFAAPLDEAFDAPPLLAMDFDADDELLDPLLLDVDEPLREAEEPPLRVALRPPPLFAAVFVAPLEAFAAVLVALPFFAAPLDEAFDAPPLLAMDFEEAPPFLAAPFDAIPPFLAAPFCAALPFFAAPPLEAMPPFLAADFLEGAAFLAAPLDEDLEAPPFWAAPFLAAPLEAPPFLAAPFDDAPFLAEAFFVAFAIFNGF